MVSVRTKVQVLDCTWEKLREDDLAAMCHLSTL